jgi:outer membrane protein assembly factor BamB
MNFTTIRLASAFLAFFMGVASPAHADWPQFHGNGSLGYEANGVLPDGWDSDDYHWQIDLGSTDVGSPVIFDGRVFVVVYSDKDQTTGLHCYDLDSGQLVWKRSYPQATYPTHARNTFASTTPAVDASGVLFAFAEPASVHLISIDHQGVEVWHRDLGRWQSSHGFGTSPIIVDNKAVLMVCSDAQELPPGVEPGESHLVGVDRLSGKDVWKTKLIATRTCYGVPSIYRSGGMTWLIESNTGNGVLAINADSGVIDWQLPILSKRVCSSPLVVGDRVICSQGQGNRGEVFAVDLPKAKGDSPRRAFEIERNAPYVTTSAVKGNRMFMAADNGVVSCVDTSSGTILWTERIGGNIGASPVIVGDKLLVLSLEGSATILDAADQFKQRAQFDLAGRAGATPAISEGSLVLRIGNELRCLKVR